VFLAKNWEFIFRTEVYKPKYKYSKPRLIRIQFDRWFYPV